MTKVVALLSWYDEPIDLLRVGVRSLRGFCDRLIALDGAYDFTPGKEEGSPADQARAIIETAEAAHISVQVHPSQAWKGQIEKRQHLFDLAAGADWVLIHDADHELGGNPRAFRKCLASLPDDVVSVEVPYTTPDVRGKFLTDWHQRLTQKTIITPLIFRCLPGLRIDRHHWWYSGLLDGQRTQLWGWGEEDESEHGGVKELPAGRRASTTTLSVTHRCFFKSDEHLRRQRNLYRARAELVAANGIEP